MSWRGWEDSISREKEYWLNNRKRICSREWLDHKRNRTEWFLDWYKDYGGIDSSSEILHVGSGAEGEINFLESGIDMR